jgi:hypothetical protein
MVIESLVRKKYFLTSEQSGAFRVSKTGREIRECMQLAILSLHSCV